MEKLRKKLSKYVNCDPDDLVILDNASAGINSILKSLKFHSNETILYYNIAYGTVKLTVQYVSTGLFTQEQIIQIDLDHQTIQNTDLLLKKTQETLQKISNVKLVIFDHISSIPAVLFDIEKMIKFFRKKNILTLVDGAHAVGDALDFRQTSANESEIFSYNHQLAIQAGNLLSQLWNSSVLIANE